MARSLKGFRHPPTTIELTITARVSCSLQVAYDRLADWRHFDQWWPIPVTSQSHPMARIVIRSLPFVQIHWSPGPARPYSFVAYKYVRGPFRGLGEWRIRGPADGPIEIDYYVRLHPTNCYVACLATTPVFRAKHRRDIRRILSRLAPQQRVPSGWMTDRL